MYNFKNTFSHKNVKHYNNQNHQYNEGSKTVSLYSQPYLDEKEQCYKNIIVLNNRPRGPLAKYVRYINFPKLSEFKQSTACSPIKNCGLALISIYNNCDNGLMLVDDIPNLMSFLIEHNYSIDTSLTKMFNTSEIRIDTNIGNKLICFIIYNGD